MKKLLGLPLSAEVSGVGRSARHSSEHSQTPCSPEQKTFGFSLCVEFWVLGYVKSYSYLVLSDQLYLLQLLPCSVWVAVSAPAVTCSFWAAVSAPDVTLFFLSSCICSSCYFFLSEQLYLLQLLHCSVWAAVSAPAVTLFSLSSCICSRCYLVLSKQLYLL